MVFLGGERVEFRVKVKSVLTYEVLKWCSDYGLFTWKAVVWLHGLCVDSVESLLMAFPGIGRYTGVFMKSEIEGISRFAFGEGLCALQSLLGGNNTGKSASFF